VLFGISFCIFIGFCDFYMAATFSKEVKSYQAGVKEVMEPVSRYQAAVAPSLWRVEKIPENTMIMVTAMMILTTMAMIMNRNNNDDAHDNDDSELAAACEISRRGAPAVASVTLGQGLF
jgi:hypothetical protein